MRFLVTGGAGFLGSHLIDRLIALDHSVVCLDNFDTGCPTNIAHLRDNPRFELVQRCVTECMEQGEEIFEVDGIFNLACPASPKAYQRKPIQTMRTSVLGALNVLELAQRRGIRVLQASTSEVYGDPLVTPQHEGYLGNVSCTGPRACYDEGKRAAEALFFDYHRTAGTRIKVARIFNTYGPRMAIDDGRVVSNWVVAALTGREIVVHGDGLQTRSFCYVDDTVDALLRLFFAGDDLTGTFNIGNTCEMQLRELLGVIVALTGTRSRVVQGKPAVDDPRQRRPDTRRIQQAMGWQARTRLTDGLSATIRYFKQKLEAQAAAQ